jgi:hypothetical protein
VEVVDDESGVSAGATASSHIVAVEEALKLLQERRAT